MNESVLRPPTTYPAYPPYHTGKYLEEYFFDFYERNKKRFAFLKREYLPIFWTNCYVNGVQEGWGERTNPADMQREINKLNPNGEYFTVIQHVDAPMNPIPQNTIMFAAGGNVQGPNIIPIPLVCGPMPINTTKDKEYLASFVGSSTSNIRNDIIEQFENERKEIDTSLGMKNKLGTLAIMENKCDIFIQHKGWDHNVNNDEFISYVDASLKSKFVICPRGYGPTSFRLYEAMQMDTVPVYISDRFWLPWISELNWNEFCVFLMPDHISDLRFILESIDDEKYESMKNKIKELYETYFTLEGTCNKILEILEDLDRGPTNYLVGHKPRDRRVDRGGIK